MESEKRNQPKYYVLCYSDGETPGKVVYGWPAVMEERKRASTRVTAKGFHTEEVAMRFLSNDIRGTVTFQNAQKPQIVVISEAI